MTKRSPPKNIFVIGAQCTGKTTLVDALEEYFSQPEKSSSRLSIIREVARDVLKRYNFTRDDITSSPERALQLQNYILEAQFEAETAVSIDPSADWYISDRSGIDPIVYAHIFVGEEAAKQLLASATWKKLEEHMKAGLVVLCEAGFSWLIDDGTRLMPKDIEDWKRLDAAFRNLLTTREIDYIVIPRDKTDVLDRVAVVVDAHK